MQRLDQTVDGLLALLLAAALHAGAEDKDLLSLAELRSADKLFAADALKVFNLKQALARRRLIGSPGTREVARQLARWKALLD